jgi:hypothetical protein
MKMIEKVARAIALRNGDQYDAIARDKPHWVEERGQFGGRFRDVNEPYQVDYLDMAEAALEAMRDPSREMTDAVDDLGRPMFTSPEDSIEGVWRSMVEAALRC